MRQRPSIVSIARQITLSCIVLFSLVLITLSLGNLYFEEKAQEKAIRESQLELQKNITRREVQSVVESVYQRKSELRPKAIRYAKERTYRAHSIAENIYQAYRDKLSANEIKALIVTALEGIRFDGGTGYYFIISLDGEVMSNASRPDFQGKSVQELESQRAKEALEDLIDLVKRKKEGSYEYKWSKPGTPDNDIDKISYAMLFEPYNFVLGTGLYLEDVEAELKDDLIKEVAKIQFRENGYFFINDYSGTVLSHGAQQEMVGTNISDYVDSRGNLVFQEIRKAVENPQGGFCRYWWKMPETGIERPKITFAQGIPEWKWLFGTGLYTDAFDSQIALMHANLREESFYEVLSILLISGILIALSYFLIGFMFRNLREDVAYFNQSFRLAANDDVLIDEEKIKSSELHDIAVDANRMLLEKKAVYHSTLRGMNHILLNFLNNMTLFKMHAEESNDFPKEIVNEIDEVIKKTTDHIKEFENIEQINEPNIERVSFKNVGS